MIKSIRVSLSQACEPFTGFFGKLQYDNTPGIKNFLADVKEGLVEPKI